MQLKIKIARYNLIYDTLYIQKNRR